MAMANIIVGDKTFAPFSQPTSNGDAAIWRVEDPLIAPMYRPTLRLTGKANSTGTNINMTLKASVPVVSLVNGVQTSQNTAIASASLTALQNVSTDEVVDAIAALIAGLTAAKSSLIAGKTTI